MKKVFPTTKAMIVALFLCAPLAAFAGDYGCDVPLDGGLSLLLAAGAGYGIKRYNDRRNKNVITEENK